MKKELRTGYTTGACAAAAAKGAAQMLACQARVEEVSITLPGGSPAVFQLHGQSFSADRADCFVIKDAGDDPDVTNGAEVWATVTANPPHLPAGERECAIIITGGRGIGRVTKPGLAIPPGAWAINPVPLEMIEESVRAAFTSHLSPFTFHLSPSTIHVVISIPDGEERAERTLNRRLGIVGGLSILGTTGIVRPVSAKAWTDTIDSALDVARACGCPTVVLSTGRTSEMAAQDFFTLHPSPVTLPEESFIMMGDHIAHALISCARHGYRQPVIACQFAKLLKIACGHGNTHAEASDLDLTTLGRMAEEAGLSPDIRAVIATANTAREIAVATGFDPALLGAVATRAGEAALKHEPMTKPRFLVCDYARNVVWSGP